MDIQLGASDGPEDLVHELEQAERVMNSLQGTLGTVYCDPGDTSSVEAAIHETAEIIDRRIAPYRSNAILVEMADAMKASHADGLRELAADATNAGDDKHG